MALTKVSGGILDPGINVAGIVTATGFDGPFTGGTGSNITAGIITATELDLNGSGNISGNLVVEGNLTANGDFTTLNTTLREVEILRVDANTTAVAGIITQTGAGDLLRLYDGSSQVVTVDDEGNVGLGSAIPAKKLDVNGTSQFRDDVTFDGATDGRDIIFDRSENTLQVKANAILKIGTGSYAADISTNGTNLNIDHNPISAFFVTTNDLQVRGKGTGGGGTYNETIFRARTGVVDLGFEPSGGTASFKLSTVGYGVTVFGTTETQKLNVTGISTLTGDVKVGSGITFHATNSRISLPDGTTGGPYTGNLELGNNRDFSIVHDSNHTYMTNRTGNFYIGISDSVFPIQLFSNNTVEIYHGSTKRIETDSLGINVLGRLDVSGTGANDHLNLDSNTTRLRIGGYADLQLFHDSTNINYISNHNDIDLHIVSTYGGSPVKTQAKFIHNGAVELYHNDEAKILTQSNGATVQDLTATGAYLSITSSSGNNGKVYGVSGTTIGFLDSQNHWLMKGIKDGAVELYHDNSPILSTTETGIEVTGELAASQDYPNFRPTLDLNFAAVKKLDPRITYRRTGVASFVNKFGKVVLVGSDIPRFDHDMVTRECKGLLIEEARTNLAKYSDMDMDSIGSGYYNNVNLSRAEGPDGVADSALQVTFTAAGSSFVRSGLIPCSAGVEYTFSVWIKKVSGSFGNSFFSYPQNASAGLFNNSGFVNTEGQQLSAMPTGVWKRFTQTKTTASGTTAMDFVMPGYDSNGATIQYYGLQMEAGAFATSYIPSTNGAATSRGYEAVTLEGTDFSDIFGTDFKEFSLVADYDNTQTNDGTNYGIIDLWGEASTYDDRIEWFKNDASPYHIETRAFGQGNPTFANGELSASSKEKSQRFATSWSVPDYSNTSSRRFVVSMGGEAVDVVSDSSGTTVPQITRMGIGCNPTRLDFSPGLLHFKRLMVYNKTLSDGQLQNLSAQ